MKIKISVTQYGYEPGTPQSYKGRTVVVFRKENDGWLELVSDPLGLFDTGKLAMALDHFKEIA